MSSLALGTALAASAVAVSTPTQRSLPYPNARPPVPWQSIRRQNREPHGITAIDWTALRDVVAAPITSAGETYYIEDGSATRAARGFARRPEFLSSLGVHIMLGRVLGRDDYAAGAEQTAVLGHALWRERFGADSSIVGRTIRLTTEGRPDATTTMRIVGVLAPGFWYGRDP